MSCGVPKVQKKVSCGTKSLHIGSEKLQGKREGFFWSFCSLVFLFYFALFFERISRCNSGWTRTHLVGEAGLRLAVIFLRHPS